MSCLITLTMCNTVRINRLSDSNTILTFHIKKVGYISRTYGSCEAQSCQKEYRCDRSNEGVSFCRSMPRPGVPCSEIQVNDLGQIRTHHRSVQNPLVANILHFMKTLNKKKKFSGFLKAIYNISLIFWVKVKFSIT